MPLDKIQTKILCLLATHRDPESYVAGGTPLNKDTPRYSDDIDIFHDREERVARAAEEDSAVLQANGYAIQWLRREPAIYTVLASKEGGTTKLEWVVDSDFRFFPTVRDDTFGYVLHPVDLAMNKVMAAAGRREPRDVVDLITINDRILPIGAVILAAVEKSPGFTPEGLINEIRRLARYTKSDFKRVASVPPVDAAEIMTRLRQVLDEADAFVARMPTDKIGVLFLKDGKVVQPDPDRLEDYQTHTGQRRGQWPSSPEIAAAMLEKYEPPNQL
ncbi:MAG: hypothetical protein HQK89_10810 [Nitrospirae bacterium]|nr:hypothetical protein [Nitrospirota bacterium]